MDPQLFLNAFIYLLAAAVAAPLGKRLGLGSVLPEALNATTLITNMAAHRDDEKSYISAAQQNLRDLESLMDNAPIRQAQQNKE